MNSASRRENAPPPRRSTERQILLAAALFAVVSLTFATFNRPPDRPPGDKADLSHLPATPPDDAWFQKTVIANPKTVLVDFGAEWCGPCKMLAPLLDKLQKEFPDQLEVVKIDIDKQPKLADHYRVNAYPTLLVFREGTVRDLQEGAGDLADLRKFITPHLTQANIQTLPPANVETPQQADAVAAPLEKVGVEPTAKM